MQIDFIFLCLILFLSQQVCDFFFLMPSITNFSSLTSEITRQLGRILFTFNLQQLHKTITVSPLQTSLSDPTLNFAPTLCFL